jgi:hypothetical protein
MKTVAVLFLALAAADVAAAAFELTQEILEISSKTVQLSAIAYENADDYADGAGNWTHPDFEEIRFYTIEPDQAILARQGGRCYVAFRGTTMTFSDWAQNTNLGDANIYKDNDETSGEFCETREGFSDFLRTDIYAQASQDLLACAAKCPDPDDCVVLTGHSQGGASAAVLSILLFSLNPIVISYGMPPAVDEGCALIPSERFYRYVNSHQDGDQTNDIGFDLVPFSPTFVSDSVHYGHYILVGPDRDAVKYLGFDTDYTFTPDLVDRDIAGHTLSGEPFSYSARIANLLNATSFPVPVDGFNNGIICEQGYAELCASGSCQNNVCTATVTELCVVASCDIDSDCVSGSCIWDACAPGNREVEVGCPCAFDRNCASGECDQALLNTNWKCVATTSAAATTLVWSILGMFVSSTVGLSVL